MQTISMNTKTIRIPIVIGRNRLRGKNEGAMVFDDFGQDNLSILRNVISMEAQMQGLAPDSEWLTKSVSQVLNIYEKAYREWQEVKGECIGFVYECTMPSSQVVLFGDPRILDRLIVKEEDDHVASH